MHPRLENELNNDEPKCKNCKHWDCIDSRTALGVCDINSARVPVYGANLVDVNPFMTLDLSVCSAWEGK